MAEDKIKKQNEEQLQDEQLDEVSGGNGWGWCDEVPWRGNNNI